MLDFKLKTRPCNTFPIDSTKNSLFLAINHREISFDAETYKNNKKIPHRLTLIRPLQAGWAAAPYKKNQTGVVTKRLSEMISTDAGPAIKLYSFDKCMSNMEKGPRRDEYTSELRAGNTLNFWLDDQRVMQMKMQQPTLPDRIPIFTVCEIQIAPKNVEGVAKASGCKIADIRPKNFTLYSCMEDVERFPPSLAEARAAMLKYQQLQPHISNDLITDEPAFHVLAHHKAYLHDDREGMPPAEVPGEEMITVVNSGADPIDIPVSTLLRYTNSTRKEWACSLLELAIANNALHLLVVSNDYWKTATSSSLRGIPLINAETLLQCITAAPTAGVAGLPAAASPPPSSSYVFTAASTMIIDDVTYAVHIHVDPEPAAVATGAPPQAPDFTLACKDIELERAYRLTFNLSNSHSGDEIPRYWVGYFDASPRRNGPAIGYRKRKITPCNEDE